MQDLKKVDLFKQENLSGEGWIEGIDKQTFDVFNPFDQSLLGKVPSLSASEIENCINQAEIAQKKWRLETAETRAKIMFKWADLIDENTDDLALMMAKEGGKPIAEAKGEIAYANSFIRWFAEEAKRTDGTIIPSKSSQLRYYVIKQPIGVCAAITPWNFPAAMITRKVAPALASGCSIIVKPAEDTPFTAMALGVLALEAGLPLGVLQFVTGESAMIGKVFCTSPIVKKLTFTGSTQVGRILMQQSGSTIKKLSMELGGNAPFIVFEDADLDAAAQGLLVSKYRNAGQTCVCANRIFVHSQVKEAFIAKLIPLVKALKVGNGVSDTTDIGPLINQKGMNKVQQLYQDAIQKGAKCEIGGAIDKVSKLAFQPTILSNVDESMTIADEEIFGPIIAIQTFESEEEVIQKANDSIYGLAAYFYTQNHARIIRVGEQLEYGMVGQNTGLISSEVTPFGGIKQSGVGREGSKLGIDEYLEIKYLCDFVG